MKKEIIFVNTSFAALYTFYAYMVPGLHESATILTFLCAVTILFYSMWEGGKSLLTLFLSYMVTAYTFSPVLLLIQRYFQGVKGTGLVATRRGGYEQAILVMGILLLSCGVKELFSGKKGNYIGSIQSKAEFKVLYVVGLTFVAVAFWVEGVGFGGKIGLAGEVPAVSQIATAISAPMIGLIVYAARDDNGTKSNLKWYAGCIPFIVFCLYLGRRQIIASIVLVVTAIVMSRRRNFKMWKKVIVSISLFILVTLLSTYYLSIRNVYRSPTSVDSSLFENYAKAAKIMYAEHTKYYELIEKNIENRGYIIGYLSKILSTKEGRAHGNLLVASTLRSIPSPLISVKFKKTLPTESGVANNIFGTYYEDYSNTPLSTGALDFGIVGALVYPFLVFIVLYISLHANLILFNARYLTIFSLFYVIGTLLAFETSFVTYLAHARNLFIINLIFTSAIFFSQDGPSNST